MHRYPLAHVANGALVRDFAAVVAKDRGVTAELLAYLGEIDARKLYLPAAYPSMFAYCVGEFHLSEDATAKRLRVARVARRCPGVLDALAEGRVHLGGLLLLAPHLTPESEAELLAAATHKTKAEIEQLLAERFPRLDVPATLQAMPAQTTESAKDLPAPGPVRDWPASQHHEAQPHPRITPLSAQSFALQCTLNQEQHEQLRYIQALLGHQVQAGDIPAVLGRAFTALIAQLEKRKFAATTRPRSSVRHATPHSRHVPAHVRRAAWMRDGGRCTFVSESGRRCEARTRLEFDHVTEFARGGEATLAEIRLRCSGHNQYQAEQTFGAGFMREKRDAARAAAKARAAARPQAVMQPTSEADENDVTPWLRALGLRADEARWAAEWCAEMPDASLEERLRVALRAFGRRRRACTA